MVPAGRAPGDFAQDRARGVNWTNRPAGLRRFLLGRPESRGPAGLGRGWGVGWFSAEPGWEGLGGDKGWGRVGGVKDVFTKFQTS